MSAHERAQLQAQMGNLVDINPQMMRQVRVCALNHGVCYICVRIAPGVGQGAAEYHQPGGEGFVSQFAAYHLF
jgi:hypothetical protein